MEKMLKTMRAAVTLLFCVTLLTGVIYPAFVTGFAQLLFNHKVNGSLIEVNGEIRGSQLLGQPFTKPQYFWGRPSATLPAYNAAASAGSNLSPGNSILLLSIKENVARLKKADPKNNAPIPVDLVTASGSGLDPHISVAAAEYQLARVALARKMPEGEIRTLIHDHTGGSFLAFIGQPRINVVLLNMALDARQGVTH